ncbi:MAG: glycosyltransferase family 4 protein [Kiritimatiellae bacterium]|nr:glycosyltransferase family 4 protein [Kiritimatiellia bacterium]
MSVPAIVLDARWVSSSPSGIGRYTLSILREFASDPGPFRFEILCGAAELPFIASRCGLPAGGTDRFRFHPLARGPFSPRGQFDAARIARATGAAVFHSTNFMLPLPLLAAPRGRRPKLVANLHDLIPLAHPEFTPHAKKTRFFPVYRALMRFIASRGDAFVTASRSAADDIRRLLSVPPEKIHVAVDGVDARFRPLAGPKPSASGAPHRILYVGRSDPYKNLPHLIDVFARAAAFGLPADTTLDIAGEPDPRYPEAPARVRALGLEGKVRFLGFIGDDELLRAYQEADALALLSRYEGFGLPVLEAMACGTPVVCADAASLPEVAGDAALLVPPDDTDEAAKALASLLADRALAARLAAAGLAQAARFTWAASARGLLETYDSLLR